MTKSECAKLIAVLLATYPSADPPSVPALTAAWEMSLGDVPYPAAEAAIRAYVKTGRFFPTPAEIRGLVASRGGIVPDAGDAWAMVRRHLRETNTVTGGMFAGPEPVRQAVEAIGGWWRLRMSETPEADRAAFGRVYEVYRQRAIADVDFGEALAAIEAGRAERAPNERGPLPREFDVAPKPIAVGDEPAPWWEG